MTDSLCTFQPVGAGSPISLGNTDCFIKASTDGVVDTYEVHAFYLRNQPGDSATDVTNAMRTDVEIYFHDLVQSLNQTEISIEDINGTKYLRTLPGAITGELINPYTGLDVTGLYLVESSFEDTGWRAYDFTLIFKKPSSLASQSPSTYKIGAGSDTALGTSNAFITTGQNTKKVTYKVFTSFSGTRGDAEVYVTTIAPVLLPLDLITIDTPTGQQYVPDSNAVAITLKNPLTSLNVSGLYCTAIDITDNGFTAVGVVFTFEKSLYAAVTAPTSDARVAVFDGIAIGNLPAQIIVNTKDPNFIYVTVKSQYKGTNFAMYAEGLADDLGLENIVKLVLPRGTAGARGVIKSYTAAPGPLSCSSLITSIANLYVDDISTSLAFEDIINIQVTFVKAR